MNDLKASYERVYGPAPHPKNNLSEWRDWQKGLTYFAAGWNCTKPRGDAEQIAEIAKLKARIADLEAKP